MTPDEVERLAREAGLVKPGYQRWNVDKERIARFAALVQAAERERMRVAGSQLANVAFNLAQKAGYVLTDDDAAMLDKLRRQWDAAIRAD